MITLYDYLPSQNAYKVRLLLHHLGQPYRTELVSIFEGHGQRPEYLAVNPTGAVPAIRLEDGRVLAESNAILQYLAEDTAYLPQDRYQRAKVAQWLSFEGEYVQSTVATLRHWTMTGKLARRPAELVAQKRAGAERVLRILDAAVAQSAFLVGERYSIADIAMFAYVGRADEANLPLPRWPALATWADRVRAQPEFLAEVFPYAIDPHAAGELPG